MRSPIIVSQARPSGAPFVIFLLCVLIAFARTVTANPVTIQDASFDTRSLAVAGLTTTLTPWLETGGTSNGNGWIERVSGFASDGQNHLAMNLNHNVWQDMSVTYQPNTRYTLTVAVGNRNSTSTLATNQSRYLLAASDGTVFATGTLNASTITVGTFTDAPALVFETGASSPASGKTIRILLQAGGAGRSHFDRVRLTAVSTNPPIVTTGAASSLTQTGATLNGTVNPLGQTASVSFSYGPTSSYGSTVTATPATVSGSTALAVSADLTGLPADSTWHYRVVAETAGGQVVGENQTFTTTSLATLKDLSLGSVPLSPGFAPATIRYSANVPFATTAIAVTPTTLHAGASATVNGVPVASGTASGPIALAEGPNLVSVAVLAADGVNRLTYTIEVTRGTVVAATFNSATTVPVTAASYTATGTVNLALNFAPATGTNLTVVRNTGNALIQGTFGNLSQGQAVILTYGGVAYPFVANYFGGTGNDLVLHWANNRMVAWGYNNYGQLGNNSTTQSGIPVGVDMTGILAGKTIVAIAAGDYHNLVLCADGTLAAWGANADGELGNNSTSTSTTPVLVTQIGVLEGKTVIAIAAGGNHSLALCADGTLAAWGLNSYGQLGNNATTGSKVPVLVTQTGVLAGKTVVAVAAGASHSLALCADGTVAAWGYNNSGQLGNNTTTNSSVPVRVTQTGVLAGKTVTSLAGGGSFSLAVCADGSVATWGYNSYGQLGNNSTAQSNVPVLVTTSGVLSGKSVVAATAGTYQTTVLCADRTLAAWGVNNSGQLGNSTSTSSSVPVLVTTSGVLAGKTVLATASGDNHSLALCADGALAAWGNNNTGQLGTANTTSSYVPVLVNTSLLRTGERFAAIKGGAEHSLALVASPPLPLATTLPATGITDTGATLRGTVNAQATSTGVSFEYGLTTSYGATVAAVPLTVTGTSPTAVSATIGGLLAGTTYHYRLVASGGSTVNGTDLTFTTTTLTTLSGLSLSSGTLNPVFDDNTSSYIATVPFAAATLAVTPTATAPDATITVAAVPVNSGSASGPLELAVGANRIDIDVSPAGGGSPRRYAVTVTRLPETFAFNSAAEVPVTASDFVATGNPANFSLNYAPVTGTTLTVVKNTGARLIQGTFANLAQGQRVNLTYGGITYPFVANYSGGTGNDLVLQWGNTRLLAWGSNSLGQLGNNTTTDNLVPAAVDMTGVLAGKTITAAATGSAHSLAMCSDGTLAAWGYNFNGQLGDTTQQYNSRLLPVLVNQTGVLAGKKVIAISGGQSFTMALCSDGLVAGWGSNQDGQLGQSSTGDFTQPAMMPMTGVLNGKTIIAIGTGAYHMLALCADGSLVTCGYNGDGNLGNNTTVYNSTTPVLVDRSGVLSGKTVTAIAVGGSHNLVLCADGAIAAWGSNSDGELGNNSTTTSAVPVLVDRSGVLAGKTVTAIAAGSYWSLALCSDGTLASWGSAYRLGNGGTTDSKIPVLVTRTGVLAGKTVIGINSGSNHALVLCADGTMAAWGYNSNGQLGNNSTTTSNLPVLVNTSALKTGERLMPGVTGRMGAHNLALVAMPPPPVVATLAATDLTDTGVTLNGTANAGGSATTVSFEYGLTTAYGTTATATPASLTGMSTTAVSAACASLLSATTYHYRVIATSAGGTLKGDDLTFTTTNLASLSGLTLSSGTLTPDFSSMVTSYIATVPYAASSADVTPVVGSAGATVKVNDVSVTSGTASGPLDLAVGNNVINVAVTAAGGGNIKTYVLTVTRLPAAFAFDSAASVPVTANGLVASGNRAVFALNYAPTAGTTLTVVRNTGLDMIRGTFDNLAQGQPVNLTYGGATYPFVANYFGGDGNDLVLQLATTRLLAWGYNGYGQLGNKSTANSNVPVPVDVSGVLAGKTVIRTAAGEGHALALCADGTLAAWGSNSYGQLGTDSIASASSLPALVDRTGVLAGKTIVNTWANPNVSFALCSDGTLASWGGYYIVYGLLGNGTSNSSRVPVLVDRTGVLAGKWVTSIAGSNSHCLALCADGTLAAWGDNSAGQLGTDNTMSSLVPVAVSQTGVLAGKQVIAIAAGETCNLALCADGTLAAWGSNSSGQLGNNSTTSSLAKVLVDRAGVLAGKTVTAISAGTSHCLALCADGTVAAWGGNTNGQLGNNSTTQSTVPVLVNRAGVLAGKTVVAISAGSTHSHALCADGTLAAWGYNNYGQLGNNSTTQSTVPVAVNMSGLAAGVRFATIRGGSGFSLATVASPPLPGVATLAASGVMDTSVTVNGSVSPNGSNATVSFQYGLTTYYGTTVAAAPAAVSGTAAIPVSFSISGLLPGIVYHYRVVATSAYGTSVGPDMTFTTTTFASLSDLAMGTGTLSPAFSSMNASYSTTVPNASDSTTVIPATTYPDATVTVNGIPVPSGSASGPISLALGNNTIPVKVTGGGGVNTRTYTVTVTRLPGVYTFNSVTNVPVTAESFSVGGSMATIALNFAPVPGTILTLLNNTGIAPIQGTFSNLAHGQAVSLSYGGLTYPFVANYYGGSGNDLVLEWANTRLVGWGANGSGQLGVGTTTTGLLPVPVYLSGPTTGKGVATAAAGGSHSFVACWDGTLAGAGYNSYGQLGSGNTNYTVTTPTVVNQTAFAGRTLAAVGGGGNHSVALLADGSLYAWGWGYIGQLGTGDTGSSNVPTAVLSTGVLAGKAAAAVAVGGTHALVLCSDGTLAAWGVNDYGQLGNNSTTNSSSPILVDRSGVLAGKTVVAIAAGNQHSLALCSDGTLAGWGYNGFGQLGDSTTTNRSLPVAVNQAGTLAGKTITTVVGGYQHSMVLCADGTLAAWGNNASGQLGDNSTTNRSAPVAVVRSGVLAGKAIVSVGAGDSHCVALCTDGTVVAWGRNTNGELGNGGTTNSSVPVAVALTSLQPGERIFRVFTGAQGAITFGLVAMPPPPVATTLATTAITDTTATLNGQVNAQGNPATVTFEYGLTESYGQTATATPASASGTNTTAVALNLSGLISGATYYYRVVATSAGGVSRGADMTFTTTTLSRLASLGVSAGTLTPAFAPSTVFYLATVPFATASFTLTPLAEIATTTIKVNGITVASGTASNPLPLAVGNNAVTVVTTAAGGMGTMTYTVMVTRMPQAFAFSSATSVPLSTGDFVATGMSAAFALSYAPVPGTDLTVINNTGVNAIQGQFSNLTHGQAVAIAFGGITYVFVADYFGGTGNDLILRWANTRPFAWGYNANGRVGNNTTADAWMPVPVDRSGYLADKVVTTVAAGSNHSLALCHDGTVAAWGSANNYQLGNGSTSNSQIPKLVSLPEALAGKTVTAITAGANHSLALCSDGTVLAWGSNSSWQLGNNSTYGAMNPVVVNRSGVLKDKRVIAMAAGDSHSMVLCDDGTLAAWGAGSNGQLGTGNTTASSVPVLVSQTGVLAGKRVTAIAAGDFHSLALCSDGTLVAWGYNSYGQLGNNSTTNSLVPVSVSLTGQFAGKAATAISAGNYQSLFLFADGSVAACGYNNYGQLGNNTTTNSSVPVAVLRTGVLLNKTVIAVSAASSRGFALCSDGTVAAWGYNFSGQLGNNSTTNSSVPVLVNTANLTTGERFTKLSGSLALAASLPGDLIPSIADGSSVIGTSQTLAWSREPLATTYQVFFGTNRDAVAAAIETSPEYLGESPTPAWTGTQPVLAANTVYYWRVDTHYATGMRPGKIWSFRIAPIKMATSVSSANIKGMAAATLDIPITSVMAAPQPWTVSGTSLPSWLTLVIATGTTPQPLQLRFTPGSLAAGLYQTMLRVVSGAAAFDLPVAFRIVEIDITKLKAHPTRPVVYGINTAASGETFARLVEIDATTGAMLRTMPIGVGPTDLDLDPVSERLYVPTMTNGLHTGTRVVDLNTWTELQSLKLVEKAYKLEATPTGRLISEGGDQWVTADLYDAANGNKLATLGTVRAGDCEVDPTGKYYYHCDANSSGARIRKYDISSDTFESVADGPILAYGSFNLILSGDGSRLFWQGFSFAANDLQTIAKLPGEVHATNRGGDLAVGSSALWWSDTGTQAAALPFTSTVAAISASDSYLVRFDSTSKAIVSTPLASLTDLPGPWPRPGQELTTSPQRLSWSPVPGATAYRLFIGADVGALQGMTTPTATVTEPFYDLPVPLAAGGFYAWRVDVLNTSGTTAGSVRTFGIRFAEGPPVPIIASSSYAATGYAVSLSDRRMLVGIGDMAQVLDFDPATGATALGQPLTALNGGEGVLSLDGEKSVFGSYSYDSTLDNIGAAFVYRQVPAGYWEHNGPLTLPTPVASELFGTSVAASGNLLLAGCGDSNSRIGRVGAFITEPAATRVQTLTAADAAAGDSFGYRIAMEGNQAVIAAPGRGSFYNRVGCLYAFTRSTTTGQWAQTQKIAIPGASTSGGSGKALALSGDLLATYSDFGAVVIYTRNPSGQWLQTSSIPRATVAGSSTAFGAVLALAGDLLFIGDTGGTYQGYGGGAVFVFRRAGATWLAQPTITPASTSPIATYTNFGGALAVRDGWLAVGGGTSRQVWMTRIDSSANRTPRFLPGIPSQGVVGRALNAAIRADDADGSDSLTIDLLQGPAWLKLTDSGNGNATLTGTPSGNSGEVSEIQLRVRDGDGAEVLYALRFTLLEPSDLPVFTVEPADTATSVGRELILAANASGVGPFQWQWYREREPLKDATQATLAFDEITMSDAGRYQVRVTNTAGEAVSSEVTVTVNPATRLGGDWPTFGGSPAHGGRHAAALDTTWFIPTWSQAVAKDGRLINRAAIAGNRAFVVPGASRNAANEVTALDLTTGTPVWSFPFPASYSSNPPSVFNGRVYFQRVNNENDSFLFCLNADTGAQLWRSPVAAQWEFYEAPAVTEQGIFVEGGTYGGMYGFNFDGSTRFFLSLPQNDGWTPTLHRGGLFSFVGGSFTEHGPANGAKLWSIPNMGGTAVIAAQGSSAAVVSGNTLNCFDLRSRSLRWKSSAAFSGRPAIGDGRVFAIQGDKVVSYALADGAPSIIYQAQTGLIGQPIVFNDRLVISSETKTWIFNLYDGAMLQTLNVGGRLSYSNGYLLAAGNDGVLRAFAALNFNPKLASLKLSTGGYLPEFDSLTTRYIATVPFDTSTVTITPTTQYPDATVKINGVPEANGSASRQLALNVGENEIQTLVTAEDGITTKTYTVVVTRLPRNFVFNSAADIPLTANGFLTGDFPINVILNYHPAPGTALTMVNNTGMGFIHGRFSNLAHGQRITLRHDGVDYDFVANYHGGSGNELVLQWADNFAVAWGQNNQGQLGNGTIVNAASPVKVELPEGVLAGKTIFALSAGYLHSLALLHDGTVASWGYNVQGQLGLGHQNASHLAARVDNTGALTGKTVIAIAAGAFHNLALCDDGTIVSWGMNTHGQLGTGDRVMRSAPVIVAPVGALADKRVVAIAAGFYHSLALCDDGTVVGWGYNDEGELGDGTSTTALVPVAVDVSGALAGKPITRISAGQYHSLALCTDGTLVAWGYNARGQLGDGTTTDRRSPTRVTLTAIAAGGAIRSISAGGSHNVARLADGTLAGWGDNARGQLDPAAASRLAVPQILAASPGRGFSAGAGHTLSERNAETIDVWGDARAASPAVLTLAGGGITEGSRFVSAATGATAFHSLAIVALPSQVGVPANTLADWRTQHFGTTASEGEAADCHDCDGDGIPNLVEYAFGLDPQQSSVGRIPQPQRVGDRLELQFSLAPAAPDIEYGAEWSPDLSPGSWRDVPDSGSGNEHVFSLPADTASKVFMRLRVRSVGSN